MFFGQNKRFWSISNYSFLSKNLAHVRGGSITDIIHHRHYRQWCSFTGRNDMVVSQNNKYLVWGVGCTGVRLALANPFWICIFSLNRANDDSIQYSIQNQIQNIHSKTYSFNRVAIIQWNYSFKKIKEHYSKFQFYHVTFKP